jgi:hypothetical protein
LLLNVLKTENACPDSDHKLQQRSFMEREEILKEFVSLFLQMALGILQNKVNHENDKKRHYMKLKCTQ